MKGRDALRLVLLLAVVSAAGIIGLLLADGGMDLVLMFLAALPLGVGLWCWRVEARKARSNVRNRPA